MTPQTKMPYVNSVTNYVREQRVPFHMPGHKQGQRINEKLRRLWGAEVFKYDLTEVDGLDYVNAPTGVIMEAEQLAAQAFGAENTFFLINGSTVGNQSAILSLVKNNEKILVPRNSHQSVYAGLILSGAKPVYIQPTLHRQSGFYPVVSTHDVEKALKDFPGIKAVHMTSPTHIGFVSNLKKIRQITDEHNIALIVDEAHGSHFQFHKDLPSSAIALGADIVVQSTHKTAGSLTQTSMLHLVRSRHVDRASIQSVLRLLQSSSPSTLLIMSLDAARHQMATEGEILLSRTLELARSLRLDINKLQSLHCYGNEVVGKDDIYDIDETKILVDISKTGHTGLELEKILGRKYKVEIEMSDINHILCFVTIGDTKVSVNRLLMALQEISLISDRKTVQEKPRLQLPKIPTLVLSPREAYFAKKKRVTFESLVGKICGEFIIPFPPDIPILVPGERIDEELLNYLKRMIEYGTNIIGPKDSSLKTLEVIEL